MKAPFSISKITQNYLWGGVVDGKTTSKIQIRIKTEISAPLQSQSFYHYCELLFLCFGLDGHGLDENCVIAFDQYNGAADKRQQQTRGSRRRRCAPVCIQR